MSYVLDTNVVSELGKVRRGAADRNVVAWERSLRPGELFISVITLMELEIGVLSIERRDPAQAVFLRAWLNTTVPRMFGGRVLPVDQVIALRCARLHVPNRSAERDAFIAATALVHGMTVVTRNVRDFAAAGVAVLNPWQA